MYYNCYKINKNYEIPLILDFDQINLNDKNKQECIDNDNSCKYGTWS